MRSFAAAALGGLALVEVVAAAPAPAVTSTSTSTSTSSSTSSSSKSASSPATTPAPTELPMGGVLTPGFTYGYTTIDGSAYPIVGGFVDGGYHFTGSGYSVTGGAGGGLSNCYATVNGQLYPAACYTGHEQDTEIFTAGGHTFYDGGLPGSSSDVVFTGRLPGPQTLSAAGALGLPDTLFAGGVATPFYTPALNAGETGRGGLGGSGTALVGGLALGGDAGATYVTALSSTSANAGAIGSVQYGPFSGQGTIGGSYNSGTPQGCFGLSGNGVGYTRCVNAPAKRTDAPRVFVPEV